MIASKLEGLKGRGNKVSWSFQFESMSSDFFRYILDSKKRWSRCLRP